MNAQPYTKEALDQLVSDYSSAPRQLFINGQLQQAASGEVFDVIDPATGEVFAQAAKGAATDIDLAVKAARTAFDSGAWPNMPPAQRARIMTRFADLIEQHGERIALTETLDNGMPFMMAKMGGIFGASEQLRYNAGWATKLRGETITPSMPGEWHTFTSREPIGVVGAIVPWNFPFVMSVAKLAPALAAGCTIILKPAEQTPLSAIMLADLIQKAGFPEGTINIVTGFGQDAGAALVNHPDVDKISFTGSTLVGKSIIQNCATDLKRITLELGGKSPVVIFPDADLAKAIPGAAMGIFGNAGQICAAGSRLFVHASIYDQVIEGVIKMASMLKVGPGLDLTSQMGPLVSQKQVERVMGYVESAKKEGASVTVGGELLSGDSYSNGYFMQPTVLTKTMSGMTAVQEEIFGPVLSTFRFEDDDLDQIAASANSTEYGLSSAIWTNDMSRGLKLAKKIKAGTVRINGGAGGVDPAVPLGGFKQSGNGREGGVWGLEDFLEVKAVSGWTNS